MEPKKILVADDDPHMVLMLHSQLTAKGYTVVSTTNDKNVVDLVKSEKPDAVVLDICMPEVGGEVIAGQIRDCQQTKDIPILFLTGLFSKEEEKRRGCVVGREVFIAKPYEIDVLVDHLEELMGATSK